MVVKIASEVDDAVGTQPKHLNKLQSAIGDAVADEVLVMLVCTHRRHGGRRSAKLCECRF